MAHNFTVDQQADSAQVCPFDHREWASGAVPAAPGDSPAPPDLMVLYFMQGACLLPQSMQFCGVLVARELVRRPYEIDILDFSRSRLSDVQVEKVVRAMNAVHVKNEVRAQWRPDGWLDQVGAQAMYKLRRLKLHTLRPITHADVDGAWGSVISEGLGRLFSLARVVPDVPCREHLPLNAREASPHAIEMVRTVLQGMPADSALLRLLEDASDLVVHGQILRDEKREYRQTVKKYGSYTPQADACRDRIAEHFLSELRERHTELDWAAYLDYRHPA